MEMVRAYAALNSIKLGGTYRIGGREMPGHEVHDLLSELANLCRPDVLRTRAEWEEVALRRTEICWTFGEMYPEDVLDRLAW